MLMLVPLEAERDSKVQDSQLSTHLTSPLDLNKLMARRNIKGGAKNHTRPIAAMISNIES